MKLTRTKFTKREIEVAIRVVMQGKQVRKWVRAQAEFLGVDLSTPEGRIFWERETRLAAEKLIS